MHLRFLAFILGALSVRAAEQQNKSRPPNFLIMVADDLGFMDLGCYGNDTMKTPRVDRLAKEGVILTKHVTPDSVCTPNRAAFYTGRYPRRFGMVSTGIFRVNLFLAEIGGLPKNETTFAHLAKRAGYETAVIGKWHLGLNCETYGDWCHHPMKLGFDYYYGLPLTNMHDFGDDGLAVIWKNQPLKTAALPATAIIAILTSILMLYKGIHPLFVLIFLFLFAGTPGSIYLLITNLRLLNSVLMRGYDIIEQPIILSDLTPRLVNEGSNFIKEAVKNDNPFLIVMNFIHPHTALITMPEFVNRSVHGKYGDAVEEMDWSVGKMLDLLDELGVGDDTFVYFGSDNAAHIEDLWVDGSRQGGYNGNLRGGKFHGGLEGAVRVPGMIRWRNRIPAGGKSVAQVTTNMDLFSTIANIVGQHHSDPERYLIDGKDMMPLMETPNPQLPELHEFIFHFCGDNVHAVRYIPRDSKSTYKYHLYLPDYVNGSEECYFMCRCGAAHRQDPPILYDLSSDENERSPIDASFKIYKDISQIIENAMSKFEATIDYGIPNQFSWERQLWRPWLQPCCGGKPFPFCGCRDDQDYSDVVEGV